MDSSTPNQFGARLSQLLGEQRSIEEAGNQILANYIDFRMNLTMRVASGELSLAQSLVVYEERKPHFVVLETAHKARIAEARITERALAMLLELHPNLS